MWYENDVEKKCLIFGRETRRDATRGLCDVCEIEGVDDGVGCVCVIVKCGVVGVLVWNDVKGVRCAIGGVVKVVN